MSTGLLPARYAGATRIGRGGMGEIFRATDTSLGRAVAIKLLDAGHAQDAAVRERFTREALAVARLSGTAGIVAIYDVGEWNGRPFIVMEYLGGGSLQERIAREGAQPLGRALAWLEQAAGALDAAHREGVVHRDVKPANLLLDRDDRVHVADFGIGSATGLGSLTQTGTVLGTASYLSPEQAMGGQTTPASDEYALGVVAFELLTGRRPFEGASLAAEATAHATAEIPAASEVERGVPRAVDAVLRKALAKHPSERYGSCAEFVAALRAALDDAAGPTRVIAPVRTPAARRARAWALPILGLAALGLVGGGVAAMALHGGGGGAAAPTISVRVVTRPGTTVVTTAPAPPTTAPPTTAPPTTAPATTAASGDPTALNDQAYRLMQQGDFASALPLLQAAVSQLSGRTDLGAAYANYNLGYTLVRLGRCGEAIPYLETARSLEPSRREVRDALKAARHCSD